MSALRVASLFSGCGTFDYAFELAGWQTMFLCEQDKRARQVLMARFPDVPLAADVREVRGADLPDCECIMFGSPCQDVSRLGKRGGMTEGSDTRSSLFFEALRIIQEKREASNGRFPQVVLWENVPGARSTGGGRDFRGILRAFLDSGARDVGWRVLDAQHFRSPQRRKRLFLIADFAGERAGQILFDSHKGGGVADSGRQAPTSDLRGAACGVDLYNFSLTGEQAHTLRASRDGGIESTPHVMRGGRIRRLTPLEAERLQGLPDGWTDVDGMADSPRYRLIGNGGHVHVLGWLANRIKNALEGGKVDYE